MNWIIGLFALIVLAWGMWLVFAWAVAKQHGVEALKAAPPIAKAFPVSEWVAGLKAIGPWVMELFGENSQIPPPPQAPGEPAPALPTVPPGEASP
jgi:hypothetical protein